MQGWRKVAAAAALVAVCAAPVRAADEGGFLEDAGWGALAMLSNVAYMPAKLLYSITGGITGGLAFLLTGANTDVAENIWVPSMGGTYVLTPRMMRGDDEIVFAASREATHTSAAPADELGGSLQEEQLSAR
jgi:hypothetical protein